MFISVNGCIYRAPEIFYIDLPCVCCDPGMSFRLDDACLSSSRALACNLSMLLPGKRARIRGRGSF